VRIRTPARSARRFVLKPSSPTSSSRRAAVARMCSTDRLARACDGTERRKRVGSSMETSSCAADPAADRVDLRVFIGKPAKLTTACRGVYIPFYAQGTGDPAIQGG